MPFQKGNKINQGRSNANAGRKPQRATDIRNQLNSHPERAHQLLEMIYQEAITKHNIPAAQYYIDQVIGKAKQSVDANVKALVAVMSPDEYALRQLERKQLKQIESSLINDYLPTILRDDKTATPDIYNGTDGSCVDALTSDGQEQTELTEPSDSTEQITEDE
jgi:hypothetical protein